ncbi:hypothetical protein [Sphingomonas sp. R86521]|uniref:hypothetical protein n=1 Tax=Sphingomonas sp. R86521 TaxID=3093860 RepID=UPI0036D3C655
MYNVVDLLMLTLGRTGRTMNVAGRTQSAIPPVRFGLLALGAASTLVAAPALAAPTQGTLGATSTGTVTITVQVPSRVQITGLTDVAFGSVEPNAQAVSSQSNCVWSNTATKGYTITASGSGTAGAFTLTSGVLAPVSYAVQWNQTTGQSSGTALAPAAVSTGFVSTATVPTCLTGPTTTSSLIVTIAPTQLATMASLTTYTGTLTLLVSPA